MRFRYVVLNQRSKWRSKATVPVRARLTVVDASTFSTLLPRDKLNMMRCAVGSGDSALTPLTCESLSHSVGLEERRYDELTICYGMLHDLPCTSATAAVAQTCCSATGPKSYR